MELASILMPALVLGGLGAALSLILLVAARKFAVYEDPLIGAVEAELPSANCGACGYAGCHAYAEALVETRDSSMFCPPGGSDTASKIAGLLGMEASGAEAPVAIVMCGGTCDVATSAGTYEGIEDCRAAALIDGGAKVCPYGCFGLGSCADACDYDAIRMENGIAVIDEAKCVGCGACVKACPRSIIRMGPNHTKVFVACSSHDMGKAVRGYCKVGCIACKRCVKACNDDAMQFDKYLARVDHEKCTECGACITACPQDIIFGIELSEEVKAQMEADRKAQAEAAAKKKAAAAAKAKAAKEAKAAKAAKEAEAAKKAEAKDDKPAAD